MIRFKINSRDVSYDGDGSTPLLWVIRDHLDMTGTKFSCGIGICGSCTVHLDGEARQSCVTPVSAIAGRSITTIEGLAQGEDLHPVQKAWLELDVSQCGYCQPGQIMSAAALLDRVPSPTDEQIDQNQTNICRCGTYPRIRKAIHRAAELSRESEE